MANKPDHQTKTPRARTTGQHTITRAIVTLADLAPRREVKGGAARVFGEASAPVLKGPPDRAEPARKPAKNR